MNNAQAAEHGKIPARLKTVEVKRAALLVKSLSVRRAAAGEKPPLLMCGFTSEMVPGQGEARLNV